MKKGEVICSSDVQRGAGANVLTEERTHYELVGPAALQIPAVAYLLTPIMQPQSKCSKVSLAS